MLSHRGSVKGGGANFSRSRSGDRKSVERNFEMIQGSESSQGGFMTHETDLMSPILFDAGPDPIMSRSHIEMANVDGTVKRRNTIDRVWGNV